MILVVGTFFLSGVVFFVLSPDPAPEERTKPGSALIAALVVSGALLPVTSWLVFRASGKKPLTAYALEELDLNEDELRQAIRLWVFFHRDKQLEGDLRFLENEDGTVSCRVTVRKEN